MDFLKNKLNLYMNILEFKSKMKLREVTCNIDEAIIQRDLIVEKVKEINQLENKFKKKHFNLEANDFNTIMEIEIKNIYKNKMEKILLIDDYKGSLGCMNGFLNALKNIKTKNFNGILVSFITDVTRCIDNYSVIYHNFTNDYNTNIENSIDFKNPLSNEVVEYATSVGMISAALIQRTYHIDYNTANEIMNDLETAGIIESKKGDRPQKVLLNFDKNNPDIIKTNSTKLIEKFQNDDIYFSIKYNVKNEINLNKNINKIDKELNGFDFEKYSSQLLVNGFNKITITQKSGDFGVDIIAYKDDIKYAIQCKKYNSPVGIKAVQEVIASKTMHDCHVAVVLTNNYFTKSAKELAQKNNVLLWDRDKLIEFLKNEK